MGFFKNLIKGKFKKIGSNLANNISKGKIISGSGFDKIINTAASAYTGGALTAIGAALPDNIGTALLGGGKPRKQDVPLVKQAVQQQVKQGTISPVEAKKLTIDLGLDEPTDEKDNTIVYVIIGAVALWFFTKKRK